MSAAVCACVVILLVDPLAPDMSGHICMGCLSTEATIQEKRGSRIRFCGTTCQGAFYASVAPAARIGFGLMNAVRDVAVETLRAKLEEIFAPYAGPDLPYVLATALALMSVHVSDSDPAFGEARQDAIYNALLDKKMDDFLGWATNDLLRAVFDHGLLQEYGDVSAVILFAYGVADTTLWNITELGGLYDAERVSYVFDRFGVMEVKVRRYLAEIFGRKTPFLMHRDYVHFARRVIKLCIEADCADETLAALESAPKDSISMYEIISLAGEAGSRVVFGQATLRLQGDIDSGRRDPQTDVTLLLARVLIRENEWV
jgi:hypothetical protein